MAGFKTYSFSWQTAYFTSVDMCVFLELCSCASFSGTSLTPLREFGLEIWFQIELASLLFLPSLYFHISCQHTLQPCLTCHCQAAVPPFHQLLNFLPARQVKNYLKTKHRTLETAKIQPRIQHLNQNAYKSTSYGSSEAAVVEESCYAESPNWRDKLAATFIADLLEDVPQRKVWFSPAHRGGGGVEGVHSAENNTWFWSALLLSKEMLSLDLVLALEKKAFHLEIRNRKPI